jgi:D-xylose transport system substrate-binding protein
MDSAVALAKGNAASTNASVDNEKEQVPSYLIDPVPVTRDNIKDTVIKDGFHTEQEIYGSSSTTVAQ